MKIDLASGSPDKLETPLLVVGTFADGTLPLAAKAIDAVSEGRLSALMRRGELKGAAGSSLLLHELPGTAAERVLLVSLGKPEAFDAFAYRAALAGAAKQLSDSVARSAVVTLADAEVAGRSLAWRLQQASHSLADAAYRFDAPGLTKGSTAGVGKITLLIAGPVEHALEKAVSRGLGVAEGVALAKDLGNLPGNVCNPEYLAKTARKLGKKFRFEVEVFDRDGIEKLGMGSFLSVGRASAAPCRFIVMHYKGGEASAKPIVLVGKGITFDTGGISLKPGAKLDEMKFDMGGAGAVLGAMRAVARLELPLNVVALVPAAENMPGGNATRPGDVVTSMSGQTIEILNTDAEGRLILCDALTYAERFEPACVIDVATLTGACVIALGGDATGLFANDDALAAELLASGQDTGDRAWQLPLWDSYQSQLDSNFADMANLGGPTAGAITAACFLARFTKTYKWAHLDIAGTGSVSGDAKGSTGRPVPLLLDFLIGRAGVAA